MRFAPIVRAEPWVAGGWMLALVAGLVPGEAAQAQGLRHDCLIQPMQTVAVGSPVIGVIEALRVERGDYVQRGQALAQLKADVEQAALARAVEQAQAGGEVKSARSAHRNALQEFVRAQELYEKKFVSETYLDKARTEAQMAAGRFDQAVERTALAQRERQLAAAQLGLRTIRSPITGVVVERLASPGEHIDDKPILKLAAIDVLRVDVLVPAQFFGQVRPGMDGLVMPELVAQGQHRAVVKQVDRVIDASSNTFRVRLELANPNHEIPAGLRCKVDLGLKTAAAVNKAS
ncbi:MAG: efflux RND transporter periplasmic adaptor subunit [Burkholderiaceae bacterium]